MNQLFDQSLVLSVVVFIAAGGGVWVAGTRLSSYADVLGDRLGLGQASMGMVFLAGATELPEIVTTATAAVSGDARLAINNMFGGIAMQTAVLSLADMALPYGPLTFFAPSAVLLLQGTVLIVLLATTVAGILTGELTTFLGIGLWPVLLTGLYVLALYALRRYEQVGEWQPVRIPDHDGVGARRTDSTYRLMETWDLVVRAAIASAVVLVCGYLLARSAGGIAQLSGLGSSFVGATILAASTSLPEVSTTIAAVRIGAFSMAVANILGSNLIMVGLILPADILYRQGPILEAVDRPAMFTIMVGIVVTAVYLIGLIERRNRQFLRMGMDSITVLVLYVASLFALYSLR